jgi:predicted outer membrane repeat protein
LFENNNAQFGGAVFLEINSTYSSSSHCNFTNNRADSRGGAVFVDYFSTYSDSSNSFFENNSAQRGGAVCI